MKPDSFWADTHLVCYSRMRARARESARSIPAVRVGAGLSDKRTTSDHLSLHTGNVSCFLSEEGLFAEPDGSTSTGKKE